MPWRLTDQEFVAALTTLRLQEEMKEGRTTELGSLGLLASLQTGIPGCPGTCRDTQATSVLYSTFSRSSDIRGRSSTQILLAVGGLHTVRNFGQRHSRLSELHGPDGLGGPERVASTSPDRKPAREDGG